MSIEDAQSTLTGLTDVIAELSISIETFQSVIEALGKPNEEMGNNAKEMNKSKFFKATKGMSGMFKSMMGASPKTAIISSFMSSIGKLTEPLKGLFGPFSVGLDIASGAVSAFVGGALGPMYEAMQPLYDTLLDTIGPASELGIAFGEALAPALESIAEPLGNLIVQFGTLFADILIELAPLFGDLIVLFIDFLSVAIEPLFSIIELFIPIIQTVMGFLIQLMPLITVITDIFNTVLMAFITPLMEVFTDVLDALSPVFDLLEDLAPVLEELDPLISLIATVISQLIEWSLVPLVGAIYGVGLVIAGLIDVFTLGTAKAVSGWNDIMLPIMESLMIPGYVGPEEVDTSGWLAPGSYHANPEDWDFSEVDVSEIMIPGMQHGGDVLSEGIYKLGEGGVKERVEPLKSIEEREKIQVAMLGELMQLNSQYKQLVEITEWNSKFPVE